ncbi:Cupredoxin, partial [Endogone sp. FLAS-F59071]
IKIKINKSRYKPFELIETQLLLLYISLTASSIERMRQSFIFTIYLFTSILLSSIVVGSTTRKYIFDVSQIKASPDGFERDILTVNGQFPGPTIEAETGDRIQVLVRNHLDVETSIHFHGMFQRGTPWVDGVAGQTQCPIPSGGWFLYDFEVPGQWGTFWWHSHYMVQYGEGLSGALIIRNKYLEPYRFEVNAEYNVLLTDWYHNNSLTLLSYYLSPASNGNEPIPQNGLINGHNSFNCSKAPAGSKCTPNAPKSVFAFKPGHKYRLRLINTSTFSAFVFSIDNHNLTIVEADGTDLQPVTVDRLAINVAQRYSVIVEANQPVASYWMRAELETSCYPVEAPDLEKVITAEIRYDGAPNPSDFSRSVSKFTDIENEECIDLSIDMLEPYWAKDAPGPVGSQVYLNITFQNDSHGVNRGFLNNVTYVPVYTKPTLFNVWSGERDYAPNQYLLEIDENQVVEIIHGHEFFVLGLGSGVYDPSNTTITNSLRFKNPLRRDTSTIPPMGWTVIRFVADNPGIWAFHCHIDWHMEAGLAMQFVELPRQIERLNIPQHVLHDCPKEAFTRGDNKFGSSTEGLTIGAPVHSNDSTYTDHHSDMSHNDTDHFHH